MFSLDIPGDLTVTILKGPLGVFVGIVYGFVAGIFLWYIPSKDCVSKRNVPFFLPICYFRSPKQWR